MKKVFIFLFIFAALYFAYTHLEEIKNTVSEQWGLMESKFSGTGKGNTGDVQKMKVKKSIEQIIPEQTKQEEEDLTNSLFEDVLNSRENEILQEERTTETQLDTQPKLPIKQEEAEQPVGLLEGLRRDGTLSFTKKYIINSEDREFQEKIIAIKNAFKTNTDGKHLTLAEITFFKKDYDKKILKLVEKYGISEDQLKVFMRFIENF